MSDDGLERLEEKLYSRTGEQEDPRRANLRPRFVDAPRGWEQPVEGEPQPTQFMRQARRPSFFSLKNIFIASIGFFIIALGIAAYFIFGGGNIISTKNIGITVSGPTDVAAGSVLPLSLTITNNNPTAIELADLVVEFPNGTRSDTDLSLAFPRLRQTIGTIAPGESVNRSIKAVLFGEQGAQEDIKISVEYRIASSNAVFSSGTTYTTTISSSPMSMVVDGPSQAVSGQQATYTLRVRSNAHAPLRNVLVTAEYPFGWSVVSATPAAVGNGRTWQLGDIPAGDERTITLVGSFTGQDGEERVLHFSAGSADSATVTSLAVPFVTKDMSVTLSRPFVGATLSLNGDSSQDIIVARGERVNGQVRWVNNLPVTVHGVTLQLSLQGTVIDPSSVQTDTGFFRSSDATILWSSQTNQALTNVAPGASGTFSFSFAPYSLQKGGNYHSSSINLSVSVSGTQDGVAAADTVDVAASRKVLVSTDLSLAASAVRSSGAFTNTGPLPPKANQQTTYTIVWDVANSANAVANASVSATLPSYVSWNNAVSPGSEQVTFDSGSRTVTWNVGNISTGNSAPTHRQIAFQVTLTPSLSQVGQAPILVNEARVSGADRFTGTTVSATSPALTTAITSDQTFHPGQENVVP